MTEDMADMQLDALLEYIKQNRGFDFTGYKRPSLTRRLKKRMNAVGVDGFGEYIDYLEVHPDEFLDLFNTVLINVTSFFRDSDSWGFVQAEVIPQIMADKKPQDPVRVWVAGCAGGQEAYTAALVLVEALGSDRFREQVKIYATDVDDDALAQARQATYRREDVVPIPPALVEKHFEQVNGHYQFRKELRRNVIFGRNDLVRDAPISRIDLLVCRNTLMYFNAETQGRILGHFHFALNPGGVLFLGKGEMLLTRGNIFTPLDLRRRLFTKVFREAPARPNGQVGTPPEPEIEEMVGRVRLREAAYEASPVAQLVVSVGGTLVLANEMARSLLRINSRDQGRPLQDLEISYRPVELRSLILEASVQRLPVEVKQVEWAGRPGSDMVLDVAVTPMQDVHGNLLGCTVSFSDVTRFRRLKQELDRSRQELETAYEELQSSNEELETTNEELQSTNEELETTNEELQATNEELETMNEELQSTNEELETINTELRQRTVELNRANSFMETVFASMRAGVVVLDRDLLIHVWNVRAEEMWGLRSDEVLGKNFLNLDIGLPVEQLRQVVRECVLGEVEYQDVLVPATNRRGKSISCRISCSRLVGKSSSLHGAILTMEELDSRGTEPPTL